MEGTSNWRKLLLMQNVNTPFSLIPKETLVSNVINPSWKLWFCFKVILTFQHNELNAENSENTYLIKICIPFPYIIKLVRNKETAYKFSRANCKRLLTKFIFFSSTKEKPFFATKSIREFLGTYILIYLKAARFQYKNVRWNKKQTCVKIVAKCVH